MKLTIIVLRDSSDFTTFFDCLRAVPSRVSFLTFVHATERRLLVKNARGFHIHSFRLFSGQLVGPVSGLLASVNSFSCAQLPREKRFFVEILLDTLELFSYRGFFVILKCRCKKPQASYYALYDYGKQRKPSIQSVSLAVCFTPSCFGCE